MLRLSASPDDRQGDEAFRRIINVPARGFGTKAMQEVESEAAFRQVPLLLALETAALPPKTRSAGLAFADAIRKLPHQGDHTSPISYRCCWTRPATGPCCARAWQSPRRTGWITSRS